MGGSWGVLASGVVAQALVLPVSPVAAFTIAQVTGMVVLFLAGHVWARLTRYDPVRSGLALSLICAAMILLALVLDAV